MSYPTNTSASDVWSIRDVYKARAGSNWAFPPPLAPTTVTATDGDPEESTITFSGQETSGPSPTFTVTSNPDNITATGSSSPITVTGLTANTGYTFTVTVDDIKGSSTSDPSNTVTPTPSFIPISATGGDVNDVTIDGKLFREHVFSGNSNYDFTVNSLGTTDGLVAYEIIADGASGDRSGTVDLGYLQGEILRKIDPFLDSNTIFEHTSAVSDAFGTQNSVPLDDTVVSQASVNGACRSDDFAGALANHYADIGRMPTLEEYINDATKGSGCGHDLDLNWTVTKGANTSEHWIARGDQDDSVSGDSRPESNGGTFFLRQVADRDINRPDPVILQDDLVLAEIQSSGHPYQIVDGPKVETNTTYNLLLGSGTSDAIPHTGKQSTDSVSGISNKGTVVIRYPIEDLSEA